MLDPKSRASVSISWGVPAEKNDSEFKTFVCFGVPRGGTSAIGGVIRKLGIFMGENVPNNHEDQEMIGRPIPKRLEVIKRRNESQKIWGWKDPNAVNYLHQLAPHLRNPHYIIVTRDVIATTKGHMRWHAREAKFSIGDISVQQQRNFMFALSCEAPVMMVSYEKAILNPKSLLAEMTEFLRCPYPEDEASYVDFLAPGAYKDAV